MFLRLLLANLVLIHGMSFAMVVHYKDKEAQKRVESFVRQYLVKKEMSIEKEKWQSLPKDKQDWYKLTRLYEKQDNPKFVARYLKNQDVPIVMIDIFPSKELIAIDPYTQWFYKNFDKQTFAKDPEIIERELLMFQDMQQKHPSYHGAIGAPLYSSVLFGRDEDVVYELEQIDKCVRGVNKVHALQKSALFCAIKHPSVKNNALKMLLQREKKLSVTWMNSQDRCDSGYALLRTAAQNKEAFELIAHTDPYKSNRMLYPHCFERKLTHLDRMKNIDSDIFDQEHIDIFVREGGMSVAEIEGMKQVGRILKGKMTLEEMAVENVWKKIIEDSNGDHSNKYLESQILLRDVQERQAREESERIFSQEALAFVSQILMGGNVHQDIENARRLLEQALRFAQER